MCTNCHNVHQEEDINFSMTKLTPDNLCMNCHKTLQRRAAHRIHTFGSCVACHMPETKGHEHSHTFQFISPELSIKAGGVDKQPNSCSGCHHHKETPVENLLRFLDAAKKRDMPKPFTAHGN
jgi:predicted CXXCH cytochrome family protein